jgi:hypothetical protein
MTFAVRLRQRPTIFDAHNTTILCHNNVTYCTPCTPHYNEFRRAQHEKQSRQGAEVRHSQRQVWSNQMHLEEQRLVMAEAA